MTYDPFREDAIESFRGVAILGPDGAKDADLDITARRDEDLGIRINVVRNGEHRRREGLRAGTVQAAEDTMVFRQYPGADATAHGVIYLGQTSTVTRADTAETTEMFSANSLEWRVGNDKATAYVVEWLLNLPKGQIWPAPAEAEAETRFEHKLGSGPNPLVMRHTGRDFHGHNTLHVQVGGVDVYIFEALDRSDPRRPGRLVFRGDVDQAERDKIRTCLAFLLGQPLVYLGHTTYDEDGQTIAMRSVDAFTARGLFFGLPTLTPYPISSQYRNLLDAGKFGLSMNALYAAYDDLNFRSLAWAYWYAVCAPFQWAAVHFGGIIEQLLRSSRPGSAGPDRLVDPAVWAKGQAQFDAWLATLAVDPEVRQILTSKFGGVNTAPPNVSLDRLLSRLGLEMAAPERNAWRDRNRAAHGGLGDDAVAAILNNKLLHILIHRLVAALSGCSDQYVDFYSFEHPFRPLRQAVPPR